MGRQWGGQLGEDIMTWVNQYPDKPPVRGEKRHSIRHVQALLIITASKNAITPRTDLEKKKSPHVRGGGFSPFNPQQGDQRGEAKQNLRLSDKGKEQIGNPIVAISIPSAAFSDLPPAPCRTYNSFLLRCYKLESENATEKDYCPYTQGSGEADLVSSGAEQHVIRQRGENSATPASVRLTVLPFGKEAVMEQEVLMSMF